MEESHLSRVSAAAISTAVSLGLPADDAVSGARTSPAASVGRPRTVQGMCRNITELRGLEPPATDDEIEAAALQYVRKVSGLRQPPAAATEAFATAVAAVADATRHLLAVVPERRQPPATVPPLRRPEVRARLGLDRP